MYECLFGILTGVAVVVAKVVALTIHDLPLLWVLSKMFSIRNAVTSIERGT